MGKRPPDKTKLAEAELAFARARLTDLQSREPAVDQRLIDETQARIAELEALVAAAGS